MHEVDGDDFDPYAPAPLTSGKTEMAEASRNPAEQFVADLIADTIEDTGACPLKDFTSLLEDYSGARTPDKRDEAALLAGGRVHKPTLPVRRRPDNPVPNSRHGGMEAGIGYGMDRAISRPPRAARI
jgi:hypothetical protein